MDCRTVGSINFIALALRAVGELEDYTRRKPSLTQNFENALNMEDMSAT
jgi:hypothetical protein